MYSKCKIATRILHTFPICACTDHICRSLYVVKGMRGWKYDENHIVVIPVIYITSVNSWQLDRLFRYTCNIACFFTLQFVTIVYLIKSHPIDSSCPLSYYQPLKHIFTWQCCYLQPTSGAVQSLLCQYSKALILWFLCSEEHCYFSACSVLSNVFRFKTCKWGIRGFTYMSASGRRWEVLSL
jgi:hypothetical protein